MSRRECKNCGDDMTRQDRDREWHYRDGLCERCRNAAEIRKTKENWYQDQYPERSGA